MSAFHMLAFPGDLPLNNQDILLAFGLTLFAGLSTGVGSGIAFFTKRTNNKFLSVSLGFSAGVMIYISFVEIFMNSRDILAGAMGTTAGHLMAILSFFFGMILIAVIDRLVPSFENPHELKLVEDITESAAERSEAEDAEARHSIAYQKAVENKSLTKRNRLYRMGMMSAAAIAIHNFPEGIATFLTALQDIRLGIPIAVAIAIHNIPEGIAVSVPIYHATGSRRKAFTLSFLSGLAEPLGALFGFLILMPFLSAELFGFLYGMVAGIMIYISIDNLLPAAREYGEPHLSLYGLMGGMAVMALSLLLLL